LARPQELRAINPDLVAAASANRDARRIDELRKQLRLPGVKDEVNVLHGILKSTRLLNAEFTVSRFRSEAESGDYRIVHIASHGVFGGNAQSSFIMAYDDVLGMNDLQSVLYAEKFRKNPIELLSLSACETAEGNDRAPLGISGAAMKARAKSVLGTLWPVQDNAARSIMEKLYSGVSKNKLSKTESLRQAQLQLIHAPDLGHPFFWAPFVLIGNWL
jgi:CHAT domain-containing protein